jgi:hypothetical protein
MKKKVLRSKAGTHHRTLAPDALQQVNGGDGLQAPQVTPDGTNLNHNETLVRSRKRSKAARPRTVAPDALRQVKGGSVEDPTGTLAGTDLNHNETLVRSR